MNPDVIAAIEALRQKGTLSDAQATTLLPSARGDLVSVHAELRVALYLGVLLVTGGAGLFLKENHERLGPTVLMSLIGIAAAICLLYAYRRCPPFSWQASASPSLVGADYVLLLGVLLIGSDLGYIETQFRWLGPNWPLHLLLVSLLYLAAAYRFDSRIVLSLALSTFAAWRGISAALPFQSSSWGEAAAEIRWNAIGCGLLFVAAGILSVRTRRKAHFESVWTTMGLLFLFGGLISGVFQEKGSGWLLWEVPLFLCAAGTSVAAYRLRRPLDFALGILAAYLGSLRLLGEALDGSALALTIAVSSIAVLAFLIRAQRRMRES